MEKLAEDIRLFHPPEWLWISKVRADKGLIRILCEERRGMPTALESRRLCFSFACVIAEGGWREGSAPRTVGEGRRTRWRMMIS